MGSTSVIEVIPYQTLLDSLFDLFDLDFREPTYFEQLLAVQRVNSLTNRDQQWHAC